jgi:predicted PurR-regulated permease PerM
MSIQSAVNRWPFVLGLIAAMAVFIWALHPILAPFLVGALIAYLGDPVVDALETRGFGRSSGVILVFLILILVTTVILLVGVPLLIDQLDQAIKQLPILYRWVSTSVLPAIHERISVSPVHLPPIDWEAELASLDQGLVSLLRFSI